MKDHTVVVPDLHGIGRSSKPEGGYDKKTQAKDLRHVVTTLGFDNTPVVAHDIGNMVASIFRRLPLRVPYRTTANCSSVNDEQNAVEAASPTAWSRHWD
jgi:pimeloyl-ACP methyl ester carboxylesterase